MKLSIYFIIINILIVNITFLSAQYIPFSERGNALFKAKSNVDETNLNFSVHNNGVLGAIKGTPDEIRFEWPKYSNNTYLYFIQPWIGAEVVSNDGDTINIVSVPAYRTDPSGDISWTTKPVEGYNNPDYGMIASSTQPLSWPTLVQGGWRDKIDDLDDRGWPGSWNSFFGKNNFLAAQELYYHTSDDAYQYSYNYYPDSTDLTRGGLGLIVSQRVLLFDFLPDEAFFISDIYNSGTKDIEKAANTLWIADLIGGNSLDDLVKYDSTRQMVYFIDADGIEINYLETATGALTFLETPFKNTKTNREETGLTGMVKYPAGSVGNWLDDRMLFNKFMSPGTFNIHNNPGEWDLWVTNGYFNLPAGEFQRLAYVITFANTREEIENKYDMLHTVYDAISKGSQTLPLTISSPGKNEIISDTYSITWDAKANDLSVKVSILHSPDNELSWSLVAKNLSNTGSYSWNTENFTDGILNKIKILAWDDSEFNLIDNESVFTINNEVESPPQIDLLSIGDGQLLSGNVTVKWIAGDADGDSVAISLSYLIKETGLTGLIAENISNEGEYIWNTIPFPNSDSYTVYAIVKNGQNSVLDSIETQVYNERFDLSDDYFISRNTIGTGSIKVNIFDSSQLKDRNYLLKFRMHNNETVYDVFDAVTKDTLVKEAFNIEGSEGPGFDGLRLFVDDDETTVLKDSSGWNNPEVYNYNFSLFYFLDILGKPVPGDFKLIIGEVGISTSTDYTTSGSTPFNFPSKDVNFKIINQTRGELSEFAFFEFDGDDGAFSIDPNNPNNADYILILERTENDSLVPTWTILLNLLNERNPQQGDTLIIKMSKAFQSGDSYYFGKGPVGLDDELIMPGKIYLQQNYPNPFNMETRIEFFLPQSGDVDIIVYNILGKKIKTLFNGHLKSGSHELMWDGTNKSKEIMASGLYFVKLKSGENSHIKKMMLIK